MKPGVSILLGLMPLLAAPAPDIPRVFHVAAGGNDANPGTEERPFATIKAAQHAVRRSAAGERSGPVTVLIHEGRYELAEPLVFGPEDSGTADHAITYAAAGGAKVVISGGRKIAGWKTDGKGAWSAAVNGIAGDFRQLAVDGRRAVRCRTPNVDEALPCFRLKDADLTGDSRTYTLRFAPRQFKDFPAGSRAEAVILGEWATMRKRIKSADAEKGIVVLAAPHVPEKTHPWNRPGKGKGCYLENAAEFLDHPGEWYLDREGGVISYLPRAGEEMATAEVVAPALTRLLEIRGTPDRPVRNLHFRGLRFSDADWHPPEEGYEGIQACHFHSMKGEGTTVSSGVIEAAIRWEWAEACGLEDSTISCVGGCGLFLGNGCSGNVVVGNRLFDIGGNGIMAGGPRTPSPAVPRRNRITDNFIHACGRDYPGAVGIWIGFTDGTTVAHNLLRDLPYSGISVGWQWNTEPTSSKGNIIEYNHIHDVMKLLSDGGGIYTLGYQPGTTIRGNLIHDIRRGPFACGAANNGMFIDEGSKAFLFERNAVYATSGEPLRFNKSNRELHEWKGNLFGKEATAKAIEQLRLDAGPAKAYRERFGITEKQKDERSSHDKRTILHQEVCMGFPMLVRWLSLGLLMVTGSAATCEERGDKTQFFPAWKEGDRWTVEIIQYRKTIARSDYKGRRIDDPKDEKYRFQVSFNVARTDEEILDRTSRADGPQCYAILVSAVNGPDAFAKRRFRLNIAREGFRPLRGIIIRSNLKEDDDFFGIHGSSSLLDVYGDKIKALVCSEHYNVEGFPVELIDMPLDKNGRLVAGIERSGGPDQFAVERKISMDTAGKKVTVDFAVFEPLYPDEKNQRELVGVIQTWEEGKPWWTTYKRYYQGYLDLEAKLLPPEEKEQSDTPPRRDRK